MEYCPELSDSDLLLAICALFARLTGFVHITQPTYILHAIYLGLLVEHQTPQKPEASKWVRYGDLNR